LGRGCKKSLRRVDRFPLNLMNKESMKGREEFSLPLLPVFCYNGISITNTLLSLRRNLDKRGGSSAEKPREV